MLFFLEEEASIVMLVMLELSALQRISSDSTSLARFTE
jgi:hypothetical protein